ncbi:MAG: PQQ-binding-like beta-propeller repeat protein [Acidobacteriota bacterium]
MRVHTARPRLRPRSPVAARAAEVRVLDAVVWRAGLAALGAVVALVVVSQFAAPASAADLETPSTRAVAPPGDALQWPGWRGPHRTGEVAESSPWPTDLQGLEQVWRVDALGPSYSGPIVGAERIYITETRDEEDEIVTAYDRATGEVAWTARWPGAMEVPFFAAKSGSWIRSTPAFDGDTLYVGGMLEVVVALDAATGAERWRVDFPERFGTPRPPFGFVSSPLVDGEHLYVEAAGSLVKLDAATGDVVWRHEGFSSGEMTSEGTFSSPVLGELHGRRQLVVQTRQQLRGVDPIDGAILWSQDVPSFRGMNILTPTLWRDHIFTSTYRNATYMYRVEPGEAGALRVAPAWQQKSQAYMSSPVVIDGIAYVHLGNGRMTALDLADGTQHWTTKPFGDYWSMAYQGTRILALDEGGELLLIEASPDEFKLLDRRTVADSSTWAYLAVAGDLVVVRSLDALTVWRWRGGERPAVSTR